MAWYIGILLKSADRLHFVYVAVGGDERKPTNVILDRRAI
jgi:hypothetical protein